MASRLVKLSIRRDLWAAYRVNVRRNWRRKKGSTDAKEPICKGKMIRTIKVSFGLMEESAAR
ncbi:hypothetical protein MNL13_01540 [Bartonella krasnovii]|uniref:Phage protein n=1 Tax=Bartonella krasnovii TaxID=2267275 RepID=A0ABY3VYJ4_9HYPH|nr:hypothetical protein [Bartonella krasnovii]UNF29486.1 hypothetical protein MNL13_01540 [Bartonella krasnovii]UNF35844.1 hypothetical protein MNL12_01540 [Bartonella krasnovii]UNF37464.1 hypothetical protein MNL11_01545 [Bartonella krasnovii]UNF49030.1 hypothetical protein MNL04_01530 [Bartonella krasnovii]